MIEVVTIYPEEPSNVQGDKDAEIAMLAHEMVYTSLATELHNEIRQRITLGDIGPDKLSPVEIEQKSRLEVHKVLANLIRDDLIRV